MMNKDKLRKLAEKACLQINDEDLVFFKGSFSVVLPMITSLLTENVPNDVIAMERIISTPLKTSELSEVYCCLSANILSKEEIEKNCPLEVSKFVVNKGT